MSAIPQENADVCIVGSGPAAITVALRLVETGCRVVMLTGGAGTETTANRDLYRGVVAEGSSHEPLEENRRRQFGGTSAAWGGRCIPFDPIDFVEREWIPHSGWPLGLEDLQSHLVRASELCEAGASVFDARQINDIEQAEILPGMDDPSIVSWPLERWSPPTNFGKRYRKDLEAAGNIRILMDAHALRLQMEPDGRNVSHVEAVDSEGNRFRIKAGKVLVACGGLENARLLLASNDVARNGVGNGGDCVGRYYMSHLFGVVAVAKLHRPKQLIYDLERDREGVYFRRRWWITPEAQQRERIGNAILFFFRPTHGFSLHRDPLFSAIYLAKFARALVRNPRPSAIRESLARNQRALLEHAGVVIGDLPTFGPTAVRIAYRRFFHYRRLPFVLPPRSANRFHLFYQTEHLPNRDSRLTLADEVDRHGVPRLKVRVTFSELDFQTVMKTHRIFADRIHQGGYGEVTYDEEQLRAQVESSRFSFNSSAHHIGTTRMSADVNHGVVDRDCRVHGVGNLYIAGSSVFPTSGHANPTLMLVALADRLGCHLRDQIATSTLSI